MTSSDIISTKKNKSPGKFGGRLRSRNKVVLKTFENTSEDDQDMFCDIISHLTSKYRPDFFETLEIAGLVRTFFQNIKFFFNFLNFYIILYSIELFST